MAQSMSVVARFSAKDDGFTSFMQKAGSHVASLGRSFAHGALMGAGMAAFQALTGGAANFVHELDETNSAWTSFNDNMKMLGSSRKEINRSKKALQSYAAATVYSSAEMASTYSQLAAGTGKSGKAVLQLVKGFGNLAATAPNSTQAMKTFSQQATQMAAKPKVAWEDFKLMYEQAPAAIEEVAKKMGIVKEVGGKQIGDAAKLVNLVKDGKVSTEDFFRAVQAAGNDQSLGKMAQKYKTIGQAMDGLRATIITKLQPAYAGLTRAGVKSITALMVAVSKGADAFKGVGKEFGKAFGAIGQQLHQMGAGKALMEGFETACRKLAGALKITAKFMQEHSKAIAVMIKLLPYLIGLLAAVKLGFMAFKAIDTLTAPAKALGDVADNATKVGKSSNGLKMLTKNAKGLVAAGATILMIAAGMALLAKSAIDLAQAGPGAVAVFALMTVALAGLGAAMVVATSKMSAISPKKLNAISVAMLAFGVAIMLCAAGFYIMATAATNLAASGTAAIVTFGLMVVAIGALAAVFAMIGPQLTAASVGMVAFGATILLIGAGIAVATAGIGFMVNAFANLNSTLPTLVQYGTAAAGSIMALGAAVLGAGATALAGGAMVMAAGALLLAGGALAIVAGAMFVAFGGMVAISAAGVLVLNAALAGVSASLTSIQASSAAAAQSLSNMQGSVSIVKAGMSAIGSAAQSAMTRMVTAFRSGAAAAASSGRQAGQGFTNGLRSGLNGAPAAARSASNSVRAALRSAAGGAYSSGVQVGRGFANGIRAMRGAVASAAASLASAANRSITVTARIHSPSKVTNGLGRYTGLGYALGIKKMVQKVRQAGAYITRAAIGSMSGGVATMPRVQDFSWDSSGPAPSSDYFYGWPSEVTVVTEVDGKVLAKTTAPLMRDEIKTIDKKADRRRGVR